MRKCKNPQCSRKAGDKNQYCSHHCAQIVYGGQKELGAEIKSRVISGVRVKNGRLETGTGKKFFWSDEWPEFISCCLPYT